MEALLSAVASDLVGRLVSFLISKFQEPGSADSGVVRLQRALLRARVVIEEAEARQVTNRAMLQQLSQLRGELCWGTYVLDAFTGQAILPRRGSHATARRGTGRLPVLVDTLEAALSDMEEVVVVLGACPRVARQPYSVYLYMERCMFGRQMEKEQIVSFLLQPAHDLEVLPVIGPHDVGKRTLVEHACLDERVRDHFAKIHYLNRDDLLLPSHEHHQGLINTAERTLFVIDLAGGDADEEEQWRRLRSSVRRGAHGESRMIIISRTEAHSGLGTVPPLRLRALRREELWYFFKAMAFGGANPEERPDGRTWRKSTGMARSELPKVTMLEVVQGVVRSEEKRFDVLVWQSRIPPYASFVATCDMERAAQVAEAGKKQIVNKRRRDQLVCGSGEDKVGK
ncbi:unnamed protein product [Urochloa decumbens]|uniref:Disease resistance N-terminal domain-containing protein n=1 Tax=Urochloa decumbens TaxID=240449 RepID=A0ABC8ZPM5_9POAL